MNTAENMNNTNKLFGSGSRPSGREQKLNNEATVETTIAEFDTTQDTLSYDFIEDKSDEESSETTSDFR